MRALGIPWGESELEGRYKGAESGYAAKRYQALWLRSRGAVPSEAAAAVGVSTETLRTWVKRAVAQGLDALAERKPGAGAKPKLDAEQQGRLLRWVDEDPTLAPARLRERVLTEWGIKVGRTQMWALLRGGGARRVVPRRRHYEADAAAQEGARKS